MLYLFEKLYLRYLSKHLATELLDRKQNLCSDAQKVLAFITDVAPPKGIVKHLRPRLQRLINDCAALNGLFDEFNKIYDKIGATPHFN